MAAARKENAMYRQGAVLLLAVVALTRDISRIGASGGTTELPACESHQNVSGNIRSVGSDLGGLMKTWEEEFRGIHPHVTFEDNLPTSDAAFPGLVTGVADLGPNGGEPSLPETLSFFEVYGYHATQVAVATGAYDVEGRSNGIIVFVHKDNPITGLTIRQLDGIFGAERTGGMQGFKWTLSEGRSRDGDIRTWGQLGLTGEWADKSIQTYGHAPSGTSRFFQSKVLGNGDKWNPNYKEYVETGSKMIAEDDRIEQRGGLKHMLANELANDRYGIAWTVLPQAKGIAGIKPVAIARDQSGSYVAASRASFQDLTYPLARNIYIYINRKPDKALRPEVAEFLRFVLSREGQDVVARSGGYLPLPASVVSEQRRKLD
jgi:phosphate transport system substrate-binding protein